jgi:general secretion pathway protein H
MRQLLKRRDMGQRGFTLLEMILVLLLAGLALGLSAFMVTGRTLPSARLNATARELSATLREARLLSRLSGERHTVSINLDMRAYGIAGRKMRSIPPDTGIVVRDPFMGEIRQGLYQLDAAGGAEGGDIVLWAGNKSVIIRMDPIIGSVTIATGK